MLEKILFIALIALMTFAIIPRPHSEETSNYTVSLEISISEIDSLLREANTPEHVIQTMDDELKRHIYDNSLSKDKVEYIEVTQDLETSNLTKSGYTISKSELQISVVAFKVAGKEQVDIYPAYEFLVPVKPIGKDYFAYTTTADYSVVPQMRSNSVWYKLNINDTWVKGNEAVYTDTWFTGYQHSGSSLGTPDAAMYVKGNFYFRVDIDLINPTNNIRIAYVHDISGDNGVSYSVGCGPASLSITPSSSSVGYQNDVFYFDY